jgi:hypothetical protein
LFTIESGVNAGNLYSYDLASETATLIASGVDGLAGASDDLSRVYYAADSELYFWEQGSGQTLIGDLSEDVEVDDPIIADYSPNPAAIRPANRVSRVTPDGSHIAFSSFTSLTGYDNRDIATGQRAREAFVWSADTEQLRCVSCPVTGARPTARQLGTEVQPHWTDARFPGWMSSLYASRVFSEDGDRLFFESYSRLSPADVNGKGDIYEWEADGTGDCSDSDPSFDSEAGGCVRLISTGESVADSRLVDASVDGSDVFITTEESLVAQDEGLIDVYDAKIDGGLASPTPAVPCDGDACQGSDNNGPTVPTAATLTFAGPEQATPGKTLKVSASKLKTVVGSTAKLKVKLPAAGVVTITGGSIRKATERSGKARQLTIPVKLSAKAKRTLKKRGTLKVGVRIGFKPAAGSNSSLRLTLTFKQPKRGRAVTNDRGGAR